jgi:endoglucanase
LLEQLCTTPGVSGREDRIRALIQRETKGLFDETRVDAMGSLIGVRRPRASKSSKTPRKPLRVMLAAHMDQIGFMVRHIDEQGFLRLNAVGGFDTRNLFARLVTVCPDPRSPRNDLPGVLNPGGRPLHIATDEDKKKIPEVSDFVVDLGLPVAQVQKKVHIGDMVVIKAPFTEVGDTVVAQALDNRVACWIVIEALRQLHKSGRGHPCEIHVVFTVQEEVGLRGASTSAYGVKPDIGVAVDTTLCVDTPGVPAEQRVTKQGDGAALTFMDGGTISDWDLALKFEAIAQKRQIKAQRSILPRGSTDAAAMQRAAAGAKAFTLSCPTRYIHTITEMVHKTDLHACRDLLAAFLEEAGRWGAART